MLLLCWNHPRKRQNTKIEYRSLLVLFMFNCEVLSFVKRFNTVDLLNRRNSIFFHNHRTKAKFNLILTALLSFFLLSSRFSLVSVVAMCYCQSTNKGNEDYRIHMLRKTHGSHDERVVVEFSIGVSLESLSRL